MRTRDDCVGTSFVVLNVGDIYLYMVALAEILTAYLLALGEHCLALAYSDCRDSLYGVNALNGCGCDFSELALELKQALSLLAGADSLTDNVSCGGNRDSSEALGVERDLDFISDFKFLSLVYLLCFLKSYLEVGVKYLVNDCLDKLYVKCVFVGIDFENDVFVSAVIVFACDYNCLLDLLEHVIHRNIFFFFEHSQGFE